MNTIFVPMLLSDAQWIFCNQKEAFDKGLLNAAGKTLTGFHSAKEAIESYNERQPQEPYAIMHVTFDSTMNTTLCMARLLTGLEKDKRGRHLWILYRQGCQRLFESGKYKLLMEIIAVEKSGLYFC